MDGLSTVRRLTLRSIVGVAVCAISFTGCAPSVEQDGPGPVGPVGPVGEEEGEPGSGNIVADQRDAGSATRVLFASEGQVQVVLGTEPSLTVEADDNLLIHLETMVDDDMLRIRTADGVDIAPSSPPRFRITLTELTEIELSGVGSIDVESVESETLSIALTGVGDITLRGADVGLLLYDLSGVGTVSITGRAQDQRGSVAGQSRYLAADYETERAMLQASGGGYAVVFVTEQFEVSVTDTATVEYYGSPSVTQDVAGLGSVSSLGQR